MRTPAEEAEQRQQRRISRYEALTERLERAREPVLDARLVSGLESHDDLLFWMEFRQLDPTFHSLDPRTGERVDYTFSLGAGDAYNWAASSQMIATARRDGGRVVYEVWETGARGASLGSFELDAPVGARWWAYAIDGDAIYIMRDEAEGTTLWRWRPDAPELTRLFDLREAGIEVGRFEDFAIFDQQMVLVESGRLWEVDLRACAARWLRNEQEVRGAWFDRRNVLYGQATAGLIHIDMQQNVIRNISRELENLDAVVLDGYEELHLWRGGDYAMHGGMVYYMSTLGALMSYDLETRNVCPVLLEPRPDPESGYPGEVYMNLVVTEGGVIYLRGMAREQGVAGFDGQIYQVNPQCVSP